MTFTPVVVFRITDVIINQPIEDFTLQITGWLSHFKWKGKSITELSGTYNSLKSLKKLNLRYVLAFLFTLTCRCINSSIGILVTS